MQSVTITLTNTTGLHARPAALFSRTAAGFQAAVTVRKGDNSVDAKSILKLLSLGAAAGSVIVISATGPDELEAVQALAALVESNFPE
ncbi:MAG: HPr family phosphocarrier protein [Sporomusaceae bacterium]|nr:HPr family phosphocarrier protein [Sporomusaceae bacterium]